MGAPKQLLVCCLALLWGDGVNGYYSFLSSGHTRIWPDQTTDIITEGDPDPNVNNHYEAKFSRAVSDFEKDQKKMEKLYHSGDTPASTKYPLIYKIHSALKSVFGKLTDAWWKDWKLWVGLFFWFAVWAKWLKYGYDEVYWQRAVFAFGINIVLLHILQFSGSILTGMITVCAILCFQALFQNIIWFGSGKRDKPELFLCDTMYLDLSLPLLQIVVLFIAQVCIWWFYITSINGNLDFDHVNYCFWFVAYLAMQMTMIFNRGSDSVLGNPFPVLDVYHLTSKSDEISLNQMDCDQGTFEISKNSMVVRALLGFFCNSILREIMAYTIPLMLMGFSEPMDFVVYCLGVNFICTIDDMGDKTFEIIPKTDSARRLFSSVADERESERIATEFAEQQAMSATAASG